MFPKILANYQTTAAGAALILGALADVAHQLATNSWDASRLQADAAGLVGGWGLIVAQDAKKKA